ncbi:MAG: CRISPR system precrRNA processing endoribonuclease RAMP protein Cas6 [Spirochaetia bacterium]
MKLLYDWYVFKIEFQKPVYFTVYPSFLFRSLLGMGMRSFACILKSNKCESCTVKQTCMYSRIFETPIPKDNNILKNRNKAPHPFVIYIPDNVYKAEQSSIEIRLLLMGDYINKLPYFFYGLKKAGEFGVLKERTPFSIIDVFHRGEKSLLKSDEQLEIPDSPLSWEVDTDGKSFSKSVLLEFESPLRMKLKGRFQKNLQYDDFIKCVYRRLSLLASLYGENGEDHSLELIKKDERMNAKWVDIPYYSGRQKEVMKMGGMKGSLALEGSFNPIELSLLEGATLFHAGKNISFGLGKVHYYEKEV